MLLSHARVNGVPPLYRESQRHKMMMMFKLQEEEGRLPPKSQLLASSRRLQTAGVTGVGSMPRDHARFRGKKRVNEAVSDPSRCRVVPRALCCHTG